jgi:hypothetical protein
VKTLFLVRGLPGSGKTTLGSCIADEYNHYHGESSAIWEADQFFMKDGEYHYDRSKIHEAHGWCQDQVRGCMRGGMEIVVVSNTFSTHWEMAVYEKMAQTYGYFVVKIDLFDRGFSDEELAKRNVHNCPIETIKRMRERWEK